MKLKFSMRGLLVAATAATVMLGSASAYALNLKMATDSGTKGSPAGDAIKKWAELIEEKSQGDIKVRVFYQNELGGQQEVFDLHVAGDVQLMLNWPMTSYDKRISVIYTPYMTTSWDEALKAYSPGGWVNGLLGGIYQDFGLKFFGPWPEGFNGVATRDKHALTIADAKDIKVRTMTVFPAPQTMEALGYQTAAIDWGEVYTALQTGVVDGEAGNVIFWDYEYFRDIVNTYVQTKHFFMTGILSMNLEAWEKLTPEQQKVIGEAALEIMNDQFKAAKQQDEYYIQKAIEAGIKYIEPTPEQLSTLGKAARDAVWPLMEKEIGADIVNTIRKNASPL